MSDLQRNFENKTDVELIAVLESKDMYTKLAMDVAQFVFDARKMPIESQSKLAKDFWNAELDESFANYFKTGEIPVSRFLSNDELREIFATYYKEHLERIEAMGVDSTKYWFV